MTDKVKTCKSERLVNVQPYARAFPRFKKREYECDKCRQCNVYRQYILQLPHDD